MKIRILNNSIRLRLGQLEIEQLAKGEAVFGEVPSFPRWFEMELSNSSQGSTRFISSP